MRKTRDAKRTSFLRCCSRSVAGCNLAGCATEPPDLQAELYPEDQQPYFKTCLARHDGTYHERELQQHRFIDIYAEPAPDEGPMTDDCVIRE